MNRSTFLTSTAAVALGGAKAPAGVTLRYPFVAAQDKLRARAVAEEVRREFLHAWNGYKQFAWGFDEVLPVSGKPKNFFVPDHSFGLSIIEAMDTLYVMELDDELHQCVQWLRSHLDFDVDASIQMFEAVIRMVAGLMSGYYATGERFLLDGARDLEIGRAHV